MAAYRRPGSVLVVIYTPERECLLLERVTPSGFWQSVIGTLRWEETPAAAAVREVREETGLTCSAAAIVTGSGGRETPMLVNASIANLFPILPEWRDRYTPGVTENLEHLWYLELPGACEVTLNSEEHIDCRWIGLEEAIDKVTSWTNREALQRLRTFGIGRR